MKRFIEESFPVKEVSAESAREKNIRHGHISTLHIWWARKPLAASRATAYAALTATPSNTDEWHLKREFIINLSKWENPLNYLLIEKARKEIRKSNGDVRPRVLDPFGGGGSIPLETLRLGCETYSNDLNPVAVIIQKCTVEYPQKFGRVKPIEVGDLLTGVPLNNPLLEDVKKWGIWVLTEVMDDLKSFYSKERNGSIPVGYIWLRTIPCQNPSCSIDIPLTVNWWLARKTEKMVSLYPYVKSGKIEFKIVGHGYEPIPPGFNPTNGTVSRAVVVCPVCRGTIEAKLTRKLFQTGKAQARLVAAVTHKPGITGKRYRIATDDDLAVFREAEAYLEEKQKELTLEWGMEAVPDEPLPPRGTLGFRVQAYGLHEWGDLFNARQKLGLISFVAKIKEAYYKMVTDGVDGEYAKAVVSYLACALNRLIDQSTVLVPWITQLEAVAHTFNRQALPMMWGFIEAFPATYFSSALDWISRVLNHCAQSSTCHASVTQSSATSLPHPTNFFDAVFTDPPYYDNVPYSYLSDFFYVWLKRTLGELYPDLFSTQLTPKRNEIVAYSHSAGGVDKAKQFFEQSLKLSFQEIHRVLKLNGIAVIVYAHKSTQGWETLINSLLDSGLIMTGAWPLDTEMKLRLRAQESAALASAIYIVARKTEREPTGFYNEVKAELTTHLNTKLHRLWEEGLGGADFFIAAIGSAIEVFGKYEKVMDFEGKVIRADRLLDDVREIATDYAVRQILKNGFAGEISDLTRFYVLWRWEYKEARVNFDDARKLAQSCGVDLAREWGGKSFVVKEKAFIRVLGPQSREMDGLRNTRELIDVLHHILLLWEKGQRDELIYVLAESGYGESEAFYRVAQAISETLPIGSKEKQLLDGFLAGRERVREEMKQGRLF